MIHNYKILIVEDERLIAEHLRVILQAQGFHHLQPVHDKAGALAALEEFQPQIVLLDIRMQHPLDGIEIAEIINLKYKVPFIFITAHSDAMILKKALETKPAGYITKPFNQANVYAAINIAIANLKEKEAEMLTLKDGFDIVKIDMNTVLYVESEGNYIDVFMDSGKKSLRHSLERFLQQVPENQFMRVHRSFVVNLKRISKISGGTICIQGKVIPVSRKYLSELKARMTGS